MRLIKTSLLFALTLLLASCSLSKDSANGRQETPAADKGMEAQTSRDVQVDNAAVHAVQEAKTTQIQ